MVGDSEQVMILKSWLYYCLDHSGETLEPEPVEKINRLIRGDKIGYPCDELLYEGD